MRGTIEKTRGEDRRSWLSRSCGGGSEEAEGYCTARCADTVGSGKGEGSPRQVMLGASRLILLLTPSGTAVHFLISRT